MAPLTPSGDEGVTGTGPQRRIDRTESDEKQDDEEKESYEDDDENKEGYVSLILYEFKKIANKFTGEAMSESKGDASSHLSTKKRKRSKSPAEPLNASTFADPAMQLKLRIPILTLRYCTTSPIKWMVYVGWAIIGVEGKVTRQGIASEDPTTITNGDIFIFEAKDETDVHYQLLSKAVDLAAIKRGMSEVTVTSYQKAFRKKKLLPRDGHFCVFSDVNRIMHLKGGHLLPSARQSEWVKLVSASRGDRVSDIDDVQNGITTTGWIYNEMDAREVAILYTPNVAMSMNDVPRNEDGRELSGRVLPVGCRYTLQWLGRMSSRNALDAFSTPCNRDAAFKANHSPSNLPSASILHYVYGAAVLEKMGIQSAGFACLLDVNEKNKPQTVFPPAPQTTTSQTPSGHNVKRQKATPMDKSYESKHNGDGGRHRQRRSTRGVPTGWERVTPEDADMLMLLFRMNNPAAQRLLEEHEHSQPENIRQWSECVHPGPPE